jgi:hypothetical protein
MINSETTLTRRRFLGRSAGLLGLAAFALSTPALAERPLARQRRGEPGGGFPHPEPRRGITSAKVLPESELGHDAEVLAAYAAARELPAVFDGIYCVCRCQRSLGHRSLLSCFESRQPTGCMGCREVAELVARRARAGETLTQIRTAVDREWG